MHTHEIRILAILAAGALAVSCMNFGPKEGTVSESVVEDLRQELKEMKEDKDILQQQYMDQNKQMTQILEELAAISGRTADLRMDLESGNAKMTQADQIEGSIDAIKAKIRALEKSNSVMSGKNREFTKMIEGFNKVIEEQEQQISTLKREIAGKEVVIKAQKDTIDSQYQTILDQKGQLERTVAQQAKMLCEAGEILESIGDNAPVVTWRRNKEKVTAHAQEVYREARRYYRMSLDAGYAPAQERLDAIDAKITQ